MANTIRTMVDNITPVIYNPNYVQSRILDTLRSSVASDDLEIMDPNNPFVFLLEAGVMTACAAIEQDEACMRKVYPIMAAEYLDLYQHMSDRDYLDRFYQPSQVNIHILIAKNELKNKAIPLNSKDVRKIVIPRDTEFTVSGYTFTMQYPIELRVMPHGGLQVVYDTSITNPVKVLASNTLDWTIRTIPYDGVEMEFLDITVPVMQYKITSRTDTITTGTPFRKSYSFSDGFFYARIWMRQNTEWVELKTTHSEQVIDPLEVTVRLTVLDAALTVYIPDVYIRNGTASGDIRVDVYTTSGKITLDLENYQYSEFTRAWKDISTDTFNEYTAPITTMSYLTVYGNEAAYGGRVGLTFTEMRDRVIDNAIGNQVIPVSDAQLETMLSDQGFTVKKSIDFVTNRIYHATVEMLDSTITDCSTPVGTLNGIFETSFSDLVTLPSVRNNGNRLTILPETLYTVEDGLVYVDSMQTVSEYRALPITERLVTANAKQLLFTPFHYVLDTNSDVFEARAYYLAKPTIESKRFVETNTSLAIDVGTAAYSIEMTDTGYRLLIVTRSDDTYKSLGSDGVFCQLSFTPRGYSQEYAYLNGVLAGYNEKELVWQFDLQTNLDIDKNHDLIVTNFIMLGDQATEIPLQLDGEFNVLLGSLNYTTADFKPIAADDVLKDGVTGAKVITHEVLKVNLGTHLSSLWTNARTIVGTTNYLRYDQDVYKQYAHDVYETDPVSGVPKFTIVGGKVKFNLLHAKGDYVLDKNGNKIIQYYKGDVMLDYNGDPIIRNKRSIRRRLELYLFDGRYAISDTSETKAYMEEVVETMVQYVTEDIPSLNDPLLEKTSIYLYPKSNIGLIEVLQADGTKVKVEAEQRFKVKYYLTSSARRDTQLLAALDNMGRQCIIDNLKLKTVSISNILASIRSTAGEDIVDVEMDGMGEKADQYIYTLVDETTKATIGKKLVANPDQTVAIVDDIAFSYTKHEVA